MSSNISRGVNCPECEKKYVNRQSLNRHLVGTHHMKFVFASNRLRLLTGEALEDALRSLRRQQWNGQGRHEDRDEETVPASITEPRLVISPINTIESDDPLDITHTGSAY